MAVAAGFYFLILRPQQQKAKKQRAQVSQWEVGDEVLTSGGLIGHIISIDDDRVTLETSVGASFVVHRQYIVRKLSVDVAEPEDDEEPGDEEYEADDEYDGDEEPEDGDGTEDDDPDDDPDDEEPEDAVDDDSGPSKAK